MLQFLLYHLDQWVVSDKHHHTESLPRIFDRSNGKQWDYVFNCGGETRYSQEDEVYKVRSLALSVAAGKEAAKRGVKAFVELSTGMVYKPDSQPSKEGDKLKPWSKIAVFKLQAEEQLANIEGYVLIIQVGTFQVWSKSRSGYPQILDRDPLQQSLHCGFLKANSISAGSISSLSDWLMSMATMLHNSCPLPCAWHVCTSTYTKK